MQLGFLSLALRFPWTYLFTLREKCPNTEFFLARIFLLSDFIYGENLRIHSEYRKTRTRKNSVFGHFSRSVIFTLWDTEREGILKLKIILLIKIFQEAIETLPLFYGLFVQKFLIKTKCSQVISAAEPMQNICIVE